MARVASTSLVSNSPLRCSAQSCSFCHDQLQVMTVRVREVHGRRLHPLVMDRSPDRDAVLFEGHHGPLEVMLAHAEGLIARDRGRGWPPRRHRGSKAPSCLLFIDRRLGRRDDRDVVEAQEAHAGAQDIHGMGLQRATPEQLESGGAASDDGASGGHAKLSAEDSCRGRDARTWRVFKGAAPGGGKVRGEERQARLDCRCLRRCRRDCKRRRGLETPEEAAVFLGSIVASGDLLLVKGSRGVKMERIVESLIAQHAAPGEFSGQELKH